VVLDEQFEIGSLSEASFDDIQGRGEDAVDRYLYALSRTGPPTAGLT
jgi:hypothetical protein